MGPPRETADGLVNPRVSVFQSGADGACELQAKPKLEQPSYCMPYPTRGPARDASKPADATRTEGRRAVMQYPICNQWSRISKDP